MHQEELRALFHENKGKKSLRQIEFESGVSASTLSRFDNGIGILDADVMIKIALWCGVETISDGAVRCSGENTLEEIQKVIERDESLSPKSKKQISSVFAAMYRAVSAI